MSRLIETSNILQLLNKLWDEHTSKVSKSNDMLKKLLDNSAKLPSTYIENLKKLSSAQNEVYESSKKLNSSTKEQVSTMLKISNNAKLLTTNLKTLRDIYSSLNSKIDVTNKKLAELKKNSDAAGTSQDKFKSKSQNLTNQLDKLNNKLAVTDNTTRKLANSTNLINLGTLTSVVSAFGMSTGVYLFADIVKNVFEVTKELESMDLALKMVSETEENFARNKEFISRVSNKWGLEVKSLTQQYIQFYTASKGLLSAQLIEKTFEGIAKAGSIMGLSLEKQSSAFYAIDQMMSKGTVTSEELKKQLGNAMPGAIKAAAMAYMDLHPQITTIQKAEEELYKAMKKGAIDSATYVPLIVDNFQKLYGIENLEGVNTLTSKVNKLSNSWTELIRSMNESETNGIGKFFSMVIDGFRISLEWLTKFSTSWDGLQKKALNNGMAEGAKDLSTVVGMGKSEEEKIAIATKEKIRAEEILNTLLKEQGEIIKKVNQWRKLGRSNVGWELSEEELEKNKFNVGYYKAIIAEANKMLNPEKVVVKTGGEDGEAKQKKERIKLEFDYIKEMYEAKKAAINKEKALYEQQMNDENKTLAERIEARVEFSKKSLELLDIEAEKQKALNVERFLDDSEKNDVEFRNKRLSFEEHEKNKSDLHKRLMYEQLKVDEDYSREWQDLYNSNEAFARKINDKKLEYSKRTSKAEVEFYQKTLKQIMDNKYVSDSNFIQSAQDLRKSEYAEAVKKRDEALRLAGNEAELKKAIWLEFSNDVKEINDRLNESLEQNRQRRIEREKQVTKYNEEAYGYKDVMGRDVEGYLSSAPQEMKDKYEELLENYRIAVRDGDEAIIEERKRQLDQFKDYITQINEYSTSFFNDFVSNSGFETLFKVLGDKIAGFGQDWKTTFLAVTEIAQEAVNFMSQNTSAYFDQMRSQLEDRYKYEIELAGDNEAAKADIDNRYEKRKRDIANREAKANKDLAMFNIAVNTAQAIMGLWVKPGFPAAIPMAIAVGALGALQLAMVASRPLPQYFTGTDNAKEGYAYTDERGAELHLDRFGAIKDFGSDNGARIKYLEEGDKIIPADKTKNILNYDSFLSSLDNQLLMNNISYIDNKNIILDVSEVVDSVKSLQETISNKESYEEHYDNRGYTKYKIKNRQRILDKSNRIRFRKG